MPTAEGQKEKISRMRQSFLLFTHAKQQAQKTEENAGKETVKGPVLQKPFYTPPTWDSSVDETYEELLASQTLKSNRAPMMAPVPGMPYLGNPLMMPAGGPQLAAGGIQIPGVASDAEPCHHGRSVSAAAAIAGDALSAVPRWWASGPATPYVCAARLSVYTSRVHDSWIC